MARITYDDQAAAAYKATEPPQGRPAFSHAR